MGLLSLRSLTSREASEFSAEALHPLADLHSNTGGAFISEFTNKTIEGNAYCLHLAFVVAFNLNGLGHPLGRACKVTSGAP